MECTPQNLADLYREESDVLVKLNDKISDHEDAEWVKSHIDGKLEKLKDKREVQEARVTILKAAIEMNSNEPVEFMLKRLEMVGRKKTEAEILEENQLDLFRDSPVATAEREPEAVVAEPDSMEPMTVLAHCLHEDVSVNEIGFRECKMCGATLGIA